jgi:MOSC domain-containing protein YiiM
MKIVSVNVGLPRGVIWQGKVVATGIFKEPVEAPVMMRKLNLDRDGQADLTVHGGVKKAVYVYLSTTDSESAKRKSSSRVLISISDELSSSLSD